MEEVQEQEEACLEANQLEVYLVDQLPQQEESILEVDNHNQLARYSEGLALNQQVEEYLGLPKSLVECLEHKILKEEVEASLEEPSQHSEEETIKELACLEMQALQEGDQVSLGSSPLWQNPQHLEDQVQLRLEAHRLGILASL